MPPVLLPVLLSATAPAGPASTSLGAVLPVHSSLVATQAGPLRSPCDPTAAPHGRSVPVHLEEGAFVLLTVEEWDAPLHLGLAHGSQVCHGTLATAHPLRLATSEPRHLGRWLPAGTHTITLSAVVPASAILTVSVTRPADLVAYGMHPELARAALRAADHAWTDNHAARSTLAVADFSLPSTHERLWVVDLAAAELRHHLFLSHGKGSGHRSDARRAVRFSNTPASNQTSLGLFRASETYTGDHGRSLRLDGLEPGVNDLARDRAIVMHGADYARVDHIAEWGYLGRSHGCPAVDDRAVQSLIDDLHDGGLLYAWAGPKSTGCCTLRAGTEASPEAPYQPDPLGLVSIY